MLNLSVFSHNHHPSGVNLLAEYIRRGIWVKDFFHFTKVFQKEDVHSPKFNHRPPGREKTTT